MIVSLT